MTGMISKKAEVLGYLQNIDYDKTNYRIAVEALIFTKDGRLLLEKRGKHAKDEIGKLEGVGGGIDPYEDLHDALKHSINTELAEHQGHIKVAIDHLLEIRCLQFDEKDKGPQDWVVVSYLCRAVAGEPHIGEPKKIEELVYLTMDELYAKDESELSLSTVAARKAYRPRYGSRPYYEVPENAE